MCLRRKVCEEKQYALATTATTSNGSVSTDTTYQTGRSAETRSRRFCIWAAEASGIWGDSFGGRSPESSSACKEATWSGRSTPPSQIRPHLNRKSVIVLVARVQSGWAWEGGGCKTRFGSKTGKIVALESIQLGRSVTVAILSPKQELCAS